MYPLSLNLRDRRVLVVGGGPVAARRAAALVDAGARVDLVAPYANEDVQALAANGRLTWHQREYAGTDLIRPDDMVWLVHACADDRAVNAAVAQAADAAGIWCVQADDAAASAAHTPAVARAGEVTVAVHAGGDPRTSRAIRNAIALLLDTGGLPLRRHRRGAGRVALVGGGPGDPGLITTRGRQLLAAADVVVYDRLAPLDLLATLGDDVELINAGKAPHAHTLTQEQINDLLVDRAREGKRVVRLKGGDPFVLGRGGEEVAACVAADVPVEVVPGVTSAIGVPTSVGIPVTHRGVAAAFTVVSGHGEISVAELAAVPGTLVVLMGLSRLAALADGLVDHGRDAHTPVAVISEGTTPQQRTVVADLRTIATKVADAGIESPAVIVVGDVVALNPLLTAESAS
ncbi:MAG: uroporphyrin-III C-methyltransferase / precorrin-2 dehydrogenase / sirohydrochlorin ferrochelatase [Frankiales bacterium]|nr:uroporphyrin-III C-methyltransferase / precorrin-2 dehydrogenase / sirohydrochlorin ferrochelatase [Frankiales bacterium]